MANLIRFALGQRLMMSHRSYAPAWERIRQCSSVANRDAGASLTAFPRRSVGTIIVINGAVALKANWLGAMNNG